MCRKVCVLDDAKELLKPRPIGEIIKGCDLIKQNFQVGSTFMILGNQFKRTGENTAVMIESRRMFVFKNDCLVDTGQKEIG